MTDIHVEHRGGVAEIRMSRPPVNQFTSQFLQSLLAAVQALPDTTRVVLLTSKLRVFAAGGDIKYMANAELDEQTRYVELCQTVYGSFEDVRWPTVAAIDGACLGGGLELALAFDIRIAAEGAVLGLPEVGLGILPGGGAVHRLVRALGQGVARDLLLTGRQISAAEAYSWGLVSRLTAPGEAATAGRAVAEALAAGSPEAISAIKSLALGASEDQFATGLALELSEWRRVRGTRNAQEGLEAFRDKRAPSFEHAARADLAVPPAP